MKRGRCWLRTTKAQFLTGLLAGRCSFGRRKLEECIITSILRTVRHNIVTSSKEYLKLSATLILFWLSMTIYKKTTIIVTNAIFRIIIYLLRSMAQSVSYLCCLKKLFYAMHENWGIGCFAKYPTNYTTELHLQTAAQFD